MRMLNIVRVYFIFLNRTFSNSSTTSEQNLACSKKKSFPALVTFESFRVAWLRSCSKTWTPLDSDDKFEFMFQDIFVSSKVYCLFEGSGIAALVLNESHPCIGSYHKSSFCIWDLTDHSHSQAPISEHITWVSIFKAGAAQHKHMDCSYQNLSAKVTGAGSNGSPYFLKKQHLSAKLPLRLATVLCAGCSIMSSYITVFKILK